MSKSSIARYCLAFGILLLLLGCSSGEPQAPRLINGTADKPKVDLEAERRRKQELQLVRVFDVDTESSFTSNVIGLDDALRSMCQDPNFPTCLRADSSGDTSGFICENTLCVTRQELCKAHAVLEIIGIRAESFDLVFTPDPLFDPNTTFHWQVPAQSAATNAALAQRALFSFGLNAFPWATLQQIASGEPVASNFCSQPVCQEPNGCAPGTAEDRDYVSALSTGFVEAYHLYKELFDVAVAQALAVADAELSSTPDLDTAVARSISAGELSRGAAAHLLVGGDPGLLGDETRGFCSVAELTPQAKAALSVFREAALPPEYVDVGSMPVSQLLAGTLQLGSVRERLGELWNHDGLRAEQSADEVAGSFGLRVEDFVEARNYLDQEIDAFSRSRTATLPPRQLVGDRVSTFPIYAATAREPVPLDPTYYATLARHTDAATFPGFANFAAATHFVLERAAEIMRQTTQPNATIRDELLNPLALLLADGRRERLGKFRLQTSASIATATARADGFSSTEGLRVVLGEDGLRCATQGSIEGADCDIDSADVTLAQLNQVAQFPAAGFVSACTSGEVTPDPTTLEGVSRVYLVRPKSGTAGRAGDFEALSGTRLISSMVHELPIVPDADRRAAEILEPSQRQCTRSKMSCAGMDFDAAIPLEDELSDDNDDVESSWKHYLTLARQSANEADLLGEEVVRVGLELDVRAEGALEELQDVCGASIGSTALLNAISGGGKGLTDLRTGQRCQTDANCDFVPHDAPTHCAATWCTRDPVAIAQQFSEVPEYNRLSECVGGDITIDFVTAGTRSMCLWHDADDKNRICNIPDSVPADARNDLVCPRAALNNDPNPNVSCPQATHFPVPQEGGPYEVAVITPDAALGYFDNDDQPPDPGALSGVCDAIRELRAGPAGINRAALLSKIRGKNYFHAARLGELIRRIGWEARFGGYSALTFDQRPLFDTGDEWTTGPSTTGWPCAAKFASNCTQGQREGLFCTQIDCTNEAQRAEMNDRMARAVLAAKLVGNNRNGDMLPVENFEVPFVSGYIFPRGLRTTRSNVLIGVEPDTISPGAFRDAPLPEQAVTAYSPNSTTTTPTLMWLTPAAEADATSPPTRLMSTDIMDPVLGPLFTFRTGSIMVAFPGTHTVVSGFKQRGSLTGGWLNGLSDAPEEDGTTEFWYRDVLAHTRLASVPSAPLPMPHRGFQTVPVGPSSQFFTSSLVLDDYLLMHDFEYSERSMLDGLELLCEMGRNLQSSCDPSKPPEVRSVFELKNATNFLDCAANEIERRAGGLIFANLPKRAFDALRNESSSGAYPAAGGEYGAEISTLRAALVEFSEVAPLIANEMKMLALDLDAVRIAMAQADINDEILDLRFLSELSAQIAACASSFEFSPIALLKAPTVCGNGFAMLAIAADIRDLNKESGNLDRQTAINQFKEKFTTRSTTFQSLAKRSLEAAEAIDGALASLEKLRSKAQRALAKALFLDSDQGGQQYAVNTVMRRRLNVARMRYETARTNAVRMAFLAKRAIELRLGMRLAEMHQELPLVPAPSTWESTLCTSTGIDYAKLRTANPNDDEKALLGQFADAYIGDYVTKLENVVESYRLVHNFHEGTDTAIISLRDDVQNVRAVCDAPVGNLLFHAGQLDHVGAAEEPGWNTVGCATELVDDVETPLPGCLFASRLDDEASEGPFPDDHPDLGSVRGYTVSFGPMGSGFTCNPSATPPTCGLTADSALQQQVELPPGRFRLSWYGRPVSGSTLNPGEIVSVATASGPITHDPPVSLSATGDWDRYHFAFDLLEGAAVTVSIRGDSTPPIAPAQVDLAAFMLEDITTTGFADPANTSPRPFANTSETLTRPLAVCEDTDGTAFRAERWRRSCVRLCPDGFSGNCTGSDARTYCFRETLFNVNQRDIEAGTILHSSSFARGNFNYRIESVGANLVGTDIRDCSDAALPSTCHGAGFATYSLKHGGPYVIRNDLGQDFRADLFTGNIEHARALAAERYLTNPLSSADRTLIGDYMRKELRGRPLDGNFVLRVWEEPGVNFDAIEDVQLVINYRYWTRFD